MLRSVLYIDLGSGESWSDIRDGLFQKWLGGTGVGTQLLLEECPAGTDPLSPGNPIIFAIGPLSAMYPVMTKTVAHFKSPLTGELGESYAGGRLAMALRFAGHEAVVIRGKSQNPCYISISGTEVAIKDASSIWGINALRTGIILRDVEVGRGRRSIIRIGQAGERRIPFAGVTVDTYRHFGRLGLGAVFGSKNLKALVVSGTEDVAIPERRSYRKVYDSIYQKVVKTDAMDKYHDIGTPVNINILNQLGGLPTKNFQDSSFTGAEKISGEALAEDYLFRRVSCAHCPIGCVHVAMLKTAFTPKHEFEVHKVSYDFELIYSLGTNLGVDSPEGLLMLIEACERLGLDAISAGVCLGWATEAYQRGLITQKETSGLVLSWGDVPSYLMALENLVALRGEFYSTLAQGVEEASQRYGGSEFAMALGRNEVAGYHTGPASLVGQLVGVRHSHLDNAGYSVDQKALKKGADPEAMVDQIIREDDSRGVFNSLVGCLFARSVYDDDTVIQALGALGVQRTREDLETLGRDIFREKYRFKVREGFDLQNARIPARFYQTASALGVIDPATVEEMLRLYRQRRGWL